MNGRSARAGFTLFEVILALAIVGLAMGVISQVVWSGMENARMTQELVQAELLAETVLGELLAGRTLAEASRLAEAFRLIMHDDEAELSDDLDPGDLEVLTGVRKFPVRVKCALLPWITLLEAMTARQEGRPVGESTTEV